MDAAAALIPLLLLSLGAHAPRPSYHRQLAETWSSIFSAPAPGDPSPEALHPEPPRPDPPAPEPPSPDAPCSSCAERKAALELSGRDPELAALRIELIKQQILKKLRLKEPPSVAKGVLPRPLSAGGGPLLLPGLPRHAAAEDYYAKTEQVILFPESGGPHCLPTTMDSSACFTLSFPTELVADAVTSVQLWIYKEKDPLDSRNQTFVVSEVAHWEANRSVQKTKLLAIQVTSVKEGWLKINLLWAVKHWLEYSEMPHAIHVTCKTCGMDPSKSPISLLPENRPFLVINTNSDNAYQRPKRNVNCVPGLSECCRESLYVSFADIGWDDWILQPPGYNAYFCRGSCSNTVSLTQSGSYYTTVMQRLLHHQGTNNKPELVPCCTATHLSPIQLIYMDNKQTITQKILPNMAVEACGCM